MAEIEGKYKNKLEQYHLPENPETEALFLLLKKDQQSFRDFKDKLITS